MDCKSIVGQHSDCGVLVLGILITAVRGTGMLHVA